MRAAPPDPSDGVALYEERGVLDGGAAITHDESGPSNSVTPPPVPCARVWIEQATVTTGQVAGIREVNINQRTSSVGGQFKNDDKQWEFHVA